MGKQHHLQKNLSDSELLEEVDLQGFLGGAIVPVVELSAGAGLLLLLDGDVSLGWTEALVRFQVDMSKAKAKLEAPGVGVGASVGVTWSYKLEVDTIARRWSSSCRGCQSTTRRRVQSWTW